MQLLEKLCFRLAVEQTAFTSAIVFRRGKTIQRHSLTVYAAALLLPAGSFLPLYLQADYGIYLSIALLALGLLYLYGTEWDRISSSKEAVVAWPKRLIKLGMFFAFSGGAIIFIGTIVVGTLTKSAALYSTIVSVGVGFYLPGILGVAAGFILRTART